MATTAGSPAVAIIGGSGVHADTLLTAPHETTVATADGEVRVWLGTVGDRPVAFLPRHGAGHVVPPHRIDYRANVRALAQLGVRRVYATAAVGALHAELASGTLVIIDQFLDFTHGRRATFHDGDTGVVHVDVADPYCPELRGILRRHVGEPARDTGTYVCTQGPRFETGAEIRMFAMLGGDVVGMTGVPEVVLARELGLCYATLATVTNLAAGLTTAPVTHEEVMAAQSAGADRLRSVLAAAVAEVPHDRTCDCSRTPTRVTPRS